MKIEDIIRVGNVDSINPENGTVRVRFPDRDDKVSGELKVVFSKTHKDKDYHIPDIDETVVCVFLLNQQEEGFVLGAYYNEVDTMTGQQEFILDLNVVIPEEFHWISIEIDENTSYCIVPRALLVSSTASNYPVVLTDGRLDMNGDGVPYARIDSNSNKLTLRRGWISEYKNIRVMGLK